MKDIRKTIQYKNKEYAIVFNLNVVEAIQDEYGTLDKWTELTSGEEPNAKAIKFGITAMLNEGIDIENEENEEQKAFLTQKQVGRLITEIGLENATQKMQETVIESTKTGEDEKNA